MKNDFRMKYPLWMMGFILVLGMFLFGVSSPVTDIVNTETEQSMSVEYGLIAGFVIIGSLLLYFLMLIIFYVQLRRHNEKNPTQKISPFAVRPPEYLEQDEGMTHITRKASQKVYSFMIWSLPMLAVFAMFSPLSRIYTVLAILLVAFIQYVIYYLEIRKHFKEEKE
ncbi:hypothetical protein A1A1_15199 [Planococcus antarcticus DSM 14505]|uniref:DUF2178 domain-containing protein n=1 Tax=Planococcus antarcticus DSM 14505 TaxID=1185653 RepID=A0A1C7DIW6_9BACL|nr:DUF3169 family protein [Planococcus antarcticus]ANU11364.1 hypothetical protein BBH88_14205 [Planococcus antarcticus DSM 14505]EIM05674.1 hypothetical protein A1A1_15199 [Planococcus antarcticus DSM 14505]